MAQLQRSFCVISAVSCIIICCSTALIHVVNFSNMDGSLYRPLGRIKSLDEPCKSSATYDHLSVIPEYTRPIAMDTEWICNLYQKVQQLEERQVTLLVCNEDYLDVLINWLAHAILYAFYPTKSILIIAFDYFTHQTLQNKGFHSVYILPEAVAKTNTNDTVANIWVARVTIARLLNYWNYSVLEFDSDAIMIKNIQPILNKFNNSDIIASAGKYPHYINKKWRAPTICMGVILIKCSPATG